MSMPAILIVCRPSPAGIADGAAPSANATGDNASCPTSAKHGNRHLTVNLSSLSLLLHAAHAKAGAICNPCHRLNLRLGGFADLVGLQQGRAIEASCIEASH